MDEATTTTGDEVRRLRLALRLAQVDAAAWLGGSRRSWQRWEAGAQPVPPGLLAALRLAAALDRRAVNWRAIVDGREV